MGYSYVKALHIIFIVTWFSGMFYLGRLFIYQREAQDKPQPDKDILSAQFAIMVKRLLFGITWPSAILTLIFGPLLLLTYPLGEAWLYIKLALVLLLFAYHFSLHILYKNHHNGLFKYSSNQLRIWNEVPTIFLVAIVMLVVVKNQMSLVYGLLGLVAFVMLLMSAIRVYKRVRERKNL